MTNKELISKIRAEIERQKEGIGLGLNEYDMGFENGKLEICNHILSFLDTIEEPVSEDLEEAAEEYADLNCHNHVENETDWNGLLYAFKAGAEWGAEHLKK